MNYTKEEEQVYATLLGRLCDLVAPLVLILGTGVEVWLYLVFATNSNLLIPISLHHDGVHLWYFKLCKGIVIWKSEFVIKTQLWEIKNIFVLLNCSRIKGVMMVEHM